MKKILIYSMMALLCVGCEDFLDTENLTKKNSSNFPKTPQDAEMSLTGAYSMLRQISENEVGQCFFITSELLSDDRFGGGGPDDKRAHAVDHLKKVDENMFAGVWRQDYSGIYRCNMLLQGLEGITWANDEQRNRIEGETRFLRAYFYFDLCRMFGTVPLITTTEPVNYPRASAEELYALIASDLVKAISMMPNTTYSAASNSDLGRASKWAAQALLARVYLFYTGYYQQPSLPLEGGSLSKAEVIAYLDDCIEHSGHDLVGDFRNLWSYSNENTKKDYAFAKDNNLSWVGEDGANVETLFAIRYTAKATWSNPWLSNQICLFMTPREPASLDDVFPFGIGWGYGPVNTKLWDNWPATDPRREGSIMNAEDELANYGWGRDKQMNETGFWQKKYAAINAYNSNHESVNFARLIYTDLSSEYMLNNTQDLVIIRFADVLLMASELKQDAIGLNRVRNRVQLPAVAYSDEALRNERRWELAFEGIRYYDLLRWGIAAQALSEQNGVSVKNNSADAKMEMSDISQRLQVTKGLMPLPKTQIDLSGNVLQQNPGWGNESNMY